MGTEAYSTTPILNQYVNGIYIGEGWDAADVNNALRQVMADIAGSGTGAVTPERFGAKGDGVTNDYAAITAARNFALANGIGTIRFNGNKTYRTSSFILCGNNLTWEFNNATLACSSQIPVIGSSYGGDPLIGQVTGEIYGPTNQLTLTSVAGLAVGDYVMFRLGNNPWDNIEPRYATVAQVLAIASNTITLDWTIPISIPLQVASTYTSPDTGATIAVPAVNGGAAFPNKAVYKISNGVNVRISDMIFKGDTPAGQSPEGVFWFQGGLNIDIDNCRSLDPASDCGTGFLGLMQFCRNVRATGPIIAGSANRRNQASLGRAFNFSNCINVDIYDAVVRNVNGTVAFVESFCEEVVFHAPQVSVDEATMGGTSFVLFFIGQGSECTVIDPTIYNGGISKSTILFDSGGTYAKITLRGTLKWRGRLPLGTGPLTGAIMDYACDNVATFTGTIAGNTLTVASVAGIPGSPISLGAEVLGAGVLAATTITAFGTGAGGNGTYTISGAGQTLGPIPMQTREYAIVDFRNPATRNLMIPLYTSMAEAFNLEGPLAEPVLYASNGYVSANLTGFYVGWDTNNGSNQSASLVAGKATVIPAFDAFGYNYGGLSRLVGQGYVLATHNATPPANGSFVGISVKVGRVISTSFINPAPTRLQPMAMTDLYMQEILQGQKSVWLEGSITYDPPSIAAGNTTTFVDVTVTGLRVGSPAVAQFSLPLGGLVLRTTTFANVARVFFDNPTAAAIDLASGTVTVQAKQQGA